MTERSKRGPGPTSLVGLVVVVGGLAGCAPPPVAEVYPQLTEYNGRLIDDVSWVNPDPFETDTLDALTETDETECRMLFLPFCLPWTDIGLRERRLDIQTVAADLGRLSLLYRQTGYFGTRIVPEIEEVSDDGPIRVMFVVNRGDGIRVDSVVVEGTEGIVDPDSMAAELPLQAGELFEVPRFLASADTVRQALLSRGHAYAEVLRNYAVDTIQDRATAWLVAVPGPRVVIDSVLVQEGENLGRRSTLRQVTFDEGDLLQRRELVASQRNLYELELVQFASVAVAPDSLQLTPEDSTTATVLVQVVEAPEHVVDTQVGYGTLDCARADGNWADRSFFGGAKRLSVGVMAGRLFCPGGASDPSIPFSQTWDYRVAGELRLPYFRSPRNNLVWTAYAERQSQPQLFQRVAQGGRFSVTHRLAPHEILTTGLDVEHRSTQAVPALYCAAFAVCTPQDIASLGQARWRNALSASWFRDRGFPLLNPTSGYTLRVGLIWTSPLLASDYDYVRANAEGALYRELRPGWVLGTYLRVGSFLTQAGIGTDDFVAPEERFYAGGASSVRGYQRNDLGPGIWLFEGEADTVAVDTLDRELDVEFYPTGGTSVSVASVELRFPSPILSGLADMAVFIDAGAVGYDPVWEMTSQWKVTPGAGLRIRTPIGPIRVDLAYNPYPQRKAPLYVQEFAEDLDESIVRRVAVEYQPDDPSLLQRLQLHIAVGPAF